MKNNNKPKPEYQVKSLDHILIEDIETELIENPRLLSIFNTKYDVIEAWYELTGLPMKRDEMYREAYVLAKQEYREMKNV